MTMKNHFFTYTKLKELNYEWKPKFIWRKIQLVNLDSKDLINYNIKNNMRLKNEQTFLDECNKESIRNLFLINILIKLMFLSIIIKVVFLMIIYLRKKVKKKKSKEK